MEIIVGANKPRCDVMRYTLNLVAW